MTTILQTAPEPQDSILALAPKADEPPDSLGFDRVLEQTAYEEVQENTDNEKSEKSAAAAEREASTLRANAKPKARKQGAEKAGKQNAGEALKNHTTKPGQLGQANGQKVESGKATEAKSTAIQRAEPLEPKKSSKVTPYKQTAESDRAKGAKRGNISNEQKAQKALKQGQARQAAKVKAQKKARLELKLEDKAKAAELRTRNSPGKVSANNLLNTTKTTVQAQNSAVREGDTANGTQVAVNTGKMVLQAKQSAPNEAAKPALVEELRPATSAEVSSQAGSQQQDLPREEAKENTLPPAPVMSVASAATGTGAVQAFTPSAGVITPMMEKIWNAVSTFRARGGDELVVKLQPDSKTEVQLTIKYGSAGVEIQARMQQGDSQQLTSGWSELQQALANRGVSLSDLVREGSAESNFEQTTRNFDKNSQNQAENMELNIGDDQGDWSALGLKSKVENKAQARREKALPGHDGWQSWA
ncbi:MAG: hypothetical protein MK236_02460 [Pedosphaera sp.]|nr:hypothetical protein [Pedosphaera sp.]